MNKVEVILSATDSVEDSACGIGLKSNPRCGLHSVSSGCMRSAMLAVLEEPAIRARVPAFSVANYHRLSELGMLSPKVELIRGALVEQMPKSPLHSSIVVLLSGYLPLHLPVGWHLRSEQPLTFTDSEPEPDLAVVRGAESAYFRAHPTTAALVIEVIVSSEALDRLKLQIYAEAGVQECWLLLAEERIIERHTEPKGSAYQKLERIAFPGMLESTIFSGVALPPATLLAV
jgi:Uma2 family endonuclease